MKRRRPLSEGKPALELVEETIHLLRLAPARIFFFYYAGTLPFVLAFLYFWADMSRSALAAHRLPAAALVLSLLYLWMKTWQSLYARELLAQIAHEPIPSWTVRRWFQICRGQAVLQPLSFFSLPLALLLFFPLAWVYAFFQNVTVLGSETPNVRTLYHRARQQAALWPRQNHVALGAWQAFGLFVVANLLVTVFVIPFLLRTLFGFENAFTRLMKNPETALATLFNTTLLTILVGMAYLCLDPMLKAFYVWRCFYGESLKSGHDLKTELSALATLKAGSPPLLVLTLLWLALAAPAVSAGATATSPPQVEAGEVTVPRLDQTIREVIARREYSWRLPPAKLSSAKKEGALANFLDSVATLMKEVTRFVKTGVEKVFDWVGRNREPAGSGRSSGGLTSILQTLVLGLSALLLGLIGVVLVRLWLRRQQRPQAVLAQPIAAGPDLTDENVAADQLPEEQWRSLGSELLNQGQLRLALRAFYLGSLADLGQRGLVTIAQFKSNRDYEGELQRRSHALPTLVQTFHDNVSTFDRVWYGLHDVNRELVDEFVHNVERIRTGS